MTDTDHARTIAELRAGNERLANELDEALEELDRVIMSCPPGARGMPAHTQVKTLRTRAETENARLTRELQEVTAQRDDLNGDVHDIGGKLETAEAEVARLRGVLQWYQEQMCEGFCRDLKTAGEYSTEMDFHCAGCKARAARQTGGDDAK